MIRFLTHSVVAAWLLLSPRFAVGSEMIEDSLVADPSQCVNICNIEFAKDSAECSSMLKSLSCDETADALFNECVALCPQDQQFSQVEY